ncbi:MAG: hypothetical protein WC797_04015 [Candidatus Paceibacterota bacterium]|jgi:hypothetical protein
MPVFGALAAFCSVLLATFGLGAQIVENSKVKKCLVSPVIVCILAPNYFFWGAYAFTKPEGIDLFLGCTQIVGFFFAFTIFAQLLIWGHATSEKEGEAAMTTPAQMPVTVESQVASSRREPEGVMAGVAIVMIMFILLCLFFATSLYDDCVRRRVKNRSVAK